MQTSVFLQFGGVFLILSATVAVFVLRGPKEGYSARDEGLESAGFRDTGDRLGSEASAATREISFAGGADTQARVQVRSEFSVGDGAREVQESSRLNSLLVEPVNSLNTVTRVRELQGMRGSLFSDTEREAALEFLAGKDLPEDMTRGSIDWVSDELLTVLRLQEPRWEGLAAELGAVAFQPGTNPVTRDYIMQHLGHIWEETGARKEIGNTLWRAVGSADETTPGTALIALNRGYGRDGNEKGLGEVRDRALELAQNTGTPLATRVTALSIAGEGGGAEVREFATKVLGNQETPLILRKVAERTLEVGP